MKNYKLHDLCVKNNWFSNGDNSQYKKLFELNKNGLIPLSGSEYLLEAIARTIWVCSDNVSVIDIIEILLENEDDQLETIADIRAEMLKQAEDLENTVVSADLDRLQFEVISELLHYYADKLKRFC